jgi:YVTN family beta-propeller protein
MQQRRCRVSVVNHREEPRDGEVMGLGATPGRPAVAVIAVHDGPISGIVASPDGSRLMVANYAGDSVSVIDTETWRVVETVAGLGEPFAIARGAHDTGRAYVSTVSPAYDSIGVIDASTSTVIATHPLALSVRDLAVSPDGKYVYACRNGGGGVDVAVLDTTTGQVEAIDLSTRPGTAAECVRVSPDGDRLYVATNGPTGGRLVVIGTQRRHVVDAVEIGLPIRDVALSPDGAIAYVASCASDWGAVIDVVDARAAKITATRKVGEIGGILTGLTLSGDGDRAYLVSDDRVAVLCTRTDDVIGIISVADQPSCVVEGPDAEYLYIADYSGMVTVAPVASIVASGAEPPALESRPSIEWVVPELGACEPAIA